MDILGLPVERLGIFEEPHKVDSESLRNNVAPLELKHACGVIPANCRDRFERIWQVIP